VLVVDETGDLKKGTSRPPRPAASPSPTTLHSCWPARPQASTNHKVLVAQRPYPSGSALRPGGDRGHGASFLSATFLAGRETVLRRLTARLTAQLTAALASVR
jgi:hypothetical protein